MMLVFSLVPTTMIVKGAGPNFMGFTEPTKHVTVGTSFYSYIYGDINSEIDTIAVDNLSYLPAGILTNNLLTPTQSKGTIFDDDYTLIFGRATDIHDSVGYAKSWKWGIDAPGSTPRVNNINATAFNTRWNAVSCGIATFTITEGGTAANGSDPGTTKYTQTVYVHPESTGFFTATTFSPTQINLGWTNGVGADKTTIRYSASTYPTTPTSGSALYNGTGTSTTHPGLTPGSHIYYSAWEWNDTAGLYSLSYQIDDATTNSPVTFGTPSPTNGSIGQNIALTWSIPINDPEGDDIDYRISCSNGDFIDVAGAGNGTRTLDITGLAYSTTYTIWVNATDPAGSGLWTRAWYDFTTKANFAPTFGTPSPTDGLTGQNLALTWSIPINDPDGNAFNWNIACSNGQSSNANGATNGTKSLSISGLAYNTNYTVWVNATDPYPPGSGLWLRKAYTFTTKIDTRPDQATNPSPANGATNVKPGIKKLECRVIDPDADSLTVKFYWANGTYIGTDTVASGGTAEVSIPTLNELTSYYWYVNVSDGILWILSPLGAPGTNWSFTTGKLAKGGGGEVYDQLSISTLFNGMPLEGAIIIIYQGIGTQATTVYAQAATKTNGLQVFNLPDGTYTIHVAKAGYQEQTRTVTLVHATALSGTTMTVIFNLQPLGAVDYTMLAGVFLLLVIGFLLSYTVVKDKTYLSPSITQLVALLLDVAAIVIGIYYFWVMAIVGAALLIIEILWMRWAK